MKKILSLILAMLVASAVLVIPALAVVGKSDSYYVADYAEVLAPDTEELICNYNGALEQQCDGAQVVVVTVDYLDGMSSDEYALQLMNDWGVGDADNANGMLLLLGVQEYKYWLATGAGIMNVFTEDMCDTYLATYFESSFDDGDYDGAVNTLFMMLLAWYDSYYGSSVIISNPDYEGNNNPIPDAEYNYDDDYYDSSAGSYFDTAWSVARTIFMVVFVLVVVLLVCIAPRRRRYYRGSNVPIFFFGSRRHRHDPHDRNRRNGRDDDHRGGGGFGGGGFGGFGGGSGSGGGGFGGGGGGFGGGGGGFGGGSGGGGGGFGGGGGGGRR